MTDESGRLNRWGQAVIKSDLLFNGDRVPRPFPGRVVSSQWGDDTNVRVPLNYYAGAKVTRLIHTLKRGASAGAAKLNWQPGGVK